MKLLTFANDKGPRLGAIITQGNVVDLAAAASVSQRSEMQRHFASMQSLIESGESGLEFARNLLDQADGRHILPLTQLKLLSPLPRPVQLCDFLCFEKHMLQGFRQARAVRAKLSPNPDATMAEMESQGILCVPEVWYEMPLYYRANPANVCGHETEIIWPPYSQIIDFEFEFACVIGSRGKDISTAKARDFIFGYTVFNDLSARDAQYRAMPGQLGPGKGKDFDNSKVLGPYLITADEIDDPYDLKMVAHLNGELFVEASSSEMTWKFEDCIAHLSQAQTLEPGEVIGSGTVGGGCAVEVGRTVKPGDVIELEVEKIGLLRSRIDPNKVDQLSAPLERNARA